MTLPTYRRGRPAPNKGRKFPAEPLTPEEIHALISACGRGPAGLRNRALIVVMARSGLRVSEALALQIKDVDLARGRITVLHGKGDRARIVGLDPEACAVVERWVAARKKLGVARSRRGTPTPLFCVISYPTAGAPVHSAYVRDLLKRLAAKAGIDKRVHPHGLRHSYASYLADRPEVSIRTVQTMLGHSSLATTERYLHHLNPSAEIEQVRTLRWPEISGPKIAE